MASKRRIAATLLAAAGALRARAKRAGMRDLIVQEALKVMARDASKRLRELVAQGEQLPYDVREAEAGSPLPQYVPLTERFIRDHGQALSALDSFGAACAAIDSTGLASPYLESFGIGVPGEDRKRGEL